MMPSAAAQEGEEGAVDDVYDRMNWPGIAVRCVEDAGASSLRPHTLGA